MPEADRQSATVPASLDGQRLDSAAAELFPSYSRTRLQRWIRDARLELNGAGSTPRTVVHAGDELSLLPEAEPEGDWAATDMPLRIVYEDAQILVIDKPVGLVVHPAAGHHDDTLLNGLLAHCPQLATIPRAGIVHRIDRDTSGLLVVAKTLAAQNHLVAAIQAREVSREYLAVVNGEITGSGIVDKPIGRHPRDRQRMAVVERGGKPARTHYGILARYRAHTLLSVTLDTGRTHQIRVHMASLGHPIVGDQVYGGRARAPRGAAEELLACLAGFRRQALHAARLRFAHPVDGRIRHFEAPLPDDMRRLVELLARDSSDHPDD